VRLRLVGGHVAEESHHVIDRGERVRDVREGPDGMIYLLTDSARGRIIRLAPPP
jgi:glucose/arabinose dehydrogenase